MKFFKTFFASFLAVIAALLIGLPILFIVIGGIISSIGSSDEEVSVKNHTVLEIKLNGPIVENASKEPLNLDLSSLGPLAGGSTKKLGMYQIVESINKAAEDDRVDGIYLNLPMSGIQTGWANIQAIRKALLDFKNAGKFIYAYAEIYGEGSYYLASVADSIYLPPEGAIEFNGLVSSPTFYTGMFEKLEIKPKIFRVGTFKSAVEPYFRKDMSDANRLQTEKYLGDMWSVFLEDVAASRGTTKDALDQLADDFVLGKGTKAIKAGLLDRVAYEYEVHETLKRASGQADAKKPTLLSLTKYFKVPPVKVNPSRNKVAVVFAEGPINSGKGGEGTIGSASLIKELAKAREDESVKAIVLRINSPGGSALASDIIAEEVRRCSEVKPIVASMGNVAASGGYYIAADCDHIFAQENTITGSIGIFGILWNAEATMNNKIGLTFDEVETNEYANIGNPFFPMSELENGLIQTNVEEGYSSFIRTVQNGRGFVDSAAVDKIAQGRVWSGRMAKGISLIDSYGDLQDAIAYAAEQAGVASEYRVRLLPRAKSPVEEIMGELMDAKMEQEIPMYEEMKQIQRIKRSIPTSGTYMLMPYELYIH